MHERPNPIREFVAAAAAHGGSNIRRIVLSNGGTSAKFFVKHFKDWLASGELVAAANDESQRAFGRALAKTTSNESSSSGRQRQIEVVCALGVSPAAAKYTYEQKRDFWEEYVYRPGLEDWEACGGNNNNDGDDDDVDSC